MPCLRCGRERSSKGCEPSTYFQPRPFSVGEANPLCKTSVPHIGPRRCSECGAAPTGYHHVGCRSEVCPFCSKSVAECVALLGFSLRNGRIVVPGCLADLQTKFRGGIPTKEEALAELKKRDRKHDEA